MRLLLAHDIVENSSHFDNVSYYNNSGGYDVPRDRFPILQYGILLGTFWILLLVCFFVYTDRRLAFDIEIHFPALTTLELPASSIPGAPRMMVLNSSSGGFSIVPRVLTSSAERQQQHAIAPARTIGSHFRDQASVHRSPNANFQGMVAVEGGEDEESPVAPSQIEMDQW